MVYQDIKRKIGLSWKGFRQYVGFDAKSEPETVQGVIQKAFVTPPTPSSTGIATTPTVPSPPAAATPTDKQPAETASPLDAPAKDVGFALPDPKKLTLDLTQFRQDFRKSVKPLAVQPPRGTFMVIGMIEIHGDRARMTLNVSAAYDPKQGRYVALQAAVWNVVPHRQSPKGGP